MQNQSIEEIMEELINAMRTGRFFIPGVSFPQGEQGPGLVTTNTSAQAEDLTMANE